MWGTPKTTLGGAGMWETKRTNGVTQLQRYKMEGTALEGFFNNFRSLYSDAPNYRIIAVNQPYWEYANGHTQESLETLMDWLENNAIFKLAQYNTGQYNEGNDDVKIRVLTDFMQAFVQIFGTLHKLPLSDNEFANVVKRMSEMPNLGNSQYQVAIVQKQAVQPAVVPAPVPGPTGQVHPVTKVSIPTAVAPVPFSGSQLVTKYERDPVTGQVRQIQVYQPAYTGYPGNYPPVGHQQVVLVPPAANIVYHPAPSSSHIVQYGVSKGPSNAVVYQHSRAGSSSAPQHAPSGYQPPVANPYAPKNPYTQPSYPPPGHQRAPSSEAPRSHSPAPIPAPYPAPPSSSSFNAPLPVSDWDARKPAAEPQVLQPMEPVVQKPAQEIQRPPSQNAFSFDHDANQAPVAASPIVLPPVPAPGSAATVATPPSAPSTEKSENSGAPGVTDEDKNLCKICFERDLDCAFLPCSHVACYHCATTLKLTKCPFCRTDITQVLKLYRA